MFRFPFKPSSGVHGHTSLGYWIGMLIYICYKECQYVAVCQFIPSVCLFVCVCVCGGGGYLSGWDYVMESFQFSNLAKYDHGPLKMVTKETETWWNEF